MNPTAAPSDILVEHPPLPVFSPSQQNLGICGVALLMAIRVLRIDRAFGIKRLNAEISGLAQYPEPEMRRIAVLVMSFLTADDFAALRDVQDEVEFSVLSGSCAADDNWVLRETEEKAFPSLTVLSGGLEDWSNPIAA